MPSHQESIREEYKDICPRCLKNKLGVFIFCQDCMKELIIKNRVKEAVYTQIEQS